MRKTRRILRVSFYIFHKPTYVLNVSPLSASPTKEMLVYIERLCCTKLNVKRQLRSIIHEISFRTLHRDMVK